LWVLTTAERPIGENEPGLLLDWPTPTASEYGTSNNVNPGDSRTEYATKGRPNLQTLAKEWATPQAHDVRTGDAQRVGRGGTKHGTRNLNDEVAATWPTPQAYGKGNRKNSEPGLTPLDIAVRPEMQRHEDRAKERRRKWPTPTAQDAEEAGGKGSIARGTRGFSLHQATQPPLDWPTPTVFGNHNRKGASPQSGDGLATSVHASWATPLARDSRTFKGAGSMPGRQGADPLSLQVSQTDGQPDAANLNMTGNPRVSSKLRLRLSAFWVACLMGLPSDWGFVSIDRALKLWGTASLRKYLSKSDLPLPDAKD
jgi:hypothetical protein